MLKPVGLHSKKIIAKYTLKYVSQFPLNKFKNVCFNWQITNLHYQLQ